MTYGKKLTRATRNELMAQIYIENPEGYMWELPEDYCSNNARVVREFNSKPEKIASVKEAHRFLVGKGKYKRARKLLKLLVNKAISIDCYGKDKSLFLYLCRIGMRPVFYENEELGCAFYI